MITHNYHLHSDFVTHAAEHIESLLHQAIKSRGFATLVLSGGNTPKPIYKKLSESTKIDWNKVYIFFGDERYIDSNHTDNNYHMAYEHLISLIDIPSKNIFPVTTNLPYIDCIVDYEKRITTFFAQHNNQESFDVVLLGLGSDGHIASLFPNTEALNEKDKYVVKNTTTEFAVKKRISLTMKAFENAHHIVFLIAGDEDKKNILQLSQENYNKPDQYPAAPLLQNNNTTVYTFFS